MKGRSKEKMSNEITTKPTIETVLERINSFEGRINERFESLENRVNERFDRVDDRFDRMDERMDKLEKEIHGVASLAHSTQVGVVTLRGDIKELRSQIRKVLPDSPA
jgi:predicted nuclease with TOPRIM domain